MAPSIHCRHPQLIRSPLFKGSDTSGFCYYRELHSSAHTHTHLNLHLSKSPFEVIFFFLVFLMGLRKINLPNSVFLFNILTLFSQESFHRFTRSDLPSFQSVPMALRHLSFHSTSPIACALNLIPVPTQDCPSLSPPTPIFQTFSHCV